MNLDEDVRTMLRERAGSVAAAPVVPDRTVRRVGMKKALSAGTTLAVVAALGVAGAFVVRSAFSSDATPLPPAGQPTVAETTNEPSPTATARDILGIPNFAPLETGTYYVDPDKDPSTPLRVVYTIAADGWLQWLGAVKNHGINEHVAVSIATVTNVVRHGCRDHSPADPPVGPTVDDLATALADLAPFRVTSPPTDITMAGYRGKNLELTVPDLPVEGPGEGDPRFTDCEGGNLASWVAPLNDGPFTGHTFPGYTEELWILDVEGSRLVIVAHSTPKAPAEDVAELRAILDSIRIEP